ncbi:MAG TPA: sensor histidine kinase [Thermomicrobiales bacterium]|nr:sensor histidine kinase [Thermomicrobiales bacterium]
MNNSRFTFSLGDGDSFRHTNTMNPPFKVNNPTIQDALDDPDAFWAKVRNLPGVRSWRILSDSLFLLSSFPLGLLWFIVTVVGFSVGFSLIIIWVGIPILAATFALLVWGAQVERSRIGAFLNVHIPSPYRNRPQQGNPVKRAWSYLRNPQLWRDLSYLLLLFPVGIVELALVFLPASYLLSPLIFMAGGTHQVNGWTINTFFEAMVAAVIGLILIVPLSMLINLTAMLHGEMGKKFLATSNEEILTERVEELTESRSAIMRAMHLERRRIERDLHDGAQQRLVSLAMELGLAREKMETDLEAARKLLEESHEDAKIVLTELRDLVRGIHPAVLTDRGLDAAISAIAGRSTIPVGVDVELRDRQPDEVEGTAYFVVVEALTNVAKHSGASEANVNIRREGGWLRITVTDNGRGGADPDKGTGLRGLKDRIAALDGRFSLVSPAGRGTTLTVEIPCA